MTGDGCTADAAQLPNVPLDIVSTQRHRAMVAAFSCRTHPTLVTTTCLYQQLGTKSGKSREKIYSEVL